VEDKNRVLIAFHSDEYTLEISPTAQLFVQIGEDSFQISGEEIKIGLELFIKLLEKYV